jgi:hypothetical protein
MDAIEDNDEPGIYSTMLDGVGDDTHFITISFVKSNNKIKDQFLTHFKYFIDLMHSNIDGHKIHPITTDKLLPILTSATDNNLPTTGTKICDCFFAQNKFSLVPGMRNKTKAPPRRLMPTPYAMNILT